MVKFILGASHALEEFLVTDRRLAHVVAVARDSFTAAAGTVLAVIDPTLKNTSAQR